MAGGSAGASVNKKFDLGSTKVTSTFLKILIPTLIAQLITGTFVVFDTLYMSNGFQPGGMFATVGTNEWTLLATGVNAAYASLGPAVLSYAAPYTYVITGVGLAIGAGIAAIITKNMVNQDEHGQQRAMNSLMPLVIMVGLVMMVVLFVLAKPLVWMASGFQSSYLDSWFNNPTMNSNWSVNPETITGETLAMVNGHILSQAAWFIRIQALGAIPLMYMSAGMIVLRVQGKADLAVPFVSIGLVCNIVFNFIFVFVLKMNAIGAAIATVIGQTLTALAYYIFYNYKSPIRSNAYDWKYAISVFGTVMKEGVSIMMVTLVTAITLLMFTFSIGVVNYGETYAITNYSSVYEVFDALFVLSNLFIVAVAQTMRPLLEYNNAKGNTENVEKIKKVGFSTGIILAIALFIIMEIFTHQFMHLFYHVNGSSPDFITTAYFMANGVIPDGGEVIYTDGIEVANRIIKIMFISFPITAFASITGTYVQSMGKDKEASILMFGKFALLLPMLLIFGFLLNDFGTSEWAFNDASGAPIEALEGYTQAHLGLFWALPFTDIVISGYALYLLLTTNGVHNGK